MSPGAPVSPEPAALHARVLDWYARHARVLPWRDPECSPWGVFLSEVMSQQTPIARVEPAWREWMARWPSPADLAAAAPGDAVRGWGRLGYPRRALRLHEAAGAMVERHGGEVPDDVEALLALPGVGPYTAAAVACFAFGRPVPVVDTNVRRVLARAVTGTANAPVSPTRVETALAARVLPLEVEAATTWNVAVMELGALVCTARAPRCGQCPAAGACAWNLAGRPAHEGPRRRGQAWHGTDRQVRGRILQTLREGADPLPSAELLAVWPDDAAKAERCLASLVEDGLVEPGPAGRFQLPA